jgi:hypothetical protein
MFKLCQLGGTKNNKLLFSNNKTKKNKNKKTLKKK